MGVLGSLISGLFGIASTESNNKANLEAVRETNQANRDLAEYAFDRNVEMWNLQNSYNTPQSQMQRYIDAGVNPNLAVSQGTSGNATSAPQYDAPHMTYYQRKALDLDFVAKHLALEKERATIKNIEADTNLKGEQSETNASQRSVNLNTAEKIALDNKWRNIVFEGDLLRYNVQARKERFEEMIRDMSIYSEGSNSEFGVSWNYDTPIGVGQSLRERTAKLEIMDMLQRISLMSSSEVKNLASLGVMSAQVEELMSRTELNYETAEKIATDVDLAIMSFDEKTFNSLAHQYGTSTLGLVAAKFNDLLRGVSTSVSEQLGNYRIPRTTEDYIERVGKARLDLENKRNARLLKRKK